jgi:hypothetical protein
MKRFFNDEQETGGAPVLPPLSDTNPLLDAEPQSTPVIEDNEEATGPGAVRPLDQAIVEEKYGNSPLFDRLRGYRANIDSLYRTTANLRTMHPPLEAGRYVSIAVTALQGARWFTGKILAEKGAEYPYTKASRSIPTVADQGEPLPLPGNLGQAVEMIRGRIEDQITETVIYIQEITPVGPIDFVSQNAVLERLLEAKMALGEIFGELAKVQTESTQNPNLITG